MGWFSSEKEPKKIQPLGDKLSLVFDNTNDIILLLNSDKEVVGANTKVEDTFNLPLKEIINNKITDLPFFNFSSTRSKLFLESLESVAGSRFQEIDALDRYGNKIILEAKIGHKDGYYAIIFKELSRPSDSSEIDLGLKFLSEVSIRLLELETEEDIFQFAADQIANLAKPACIYVNKLVEKGKFKCVAYAITGENFAKGIKITGSPVGNIYDASDKAEFTVRRGKVTKVIGGIHELSGGKIPKPIAVLGEALAGVKSVFNIGFYWKGDIYGNASIITQKKSDKPQNSGIIETFANLVSVAIQRKKAEDQLVATIKELDLEKIRATREKDKLDIILRSAGDGFIVVDSNQNIILTNDAIVDLSGFDNAVNRNFGKTFKFITEKKTEFPDFVSECIKTGQIKRIVNKAVLVTKEKKELPVDITVSSLKSENNTNGCVIVIRDATKEREIDRTKSEFVSLASHQLRSPLAAINWSIEMLLNDKKEKLSEKQHEYISEVYRSSRRMNDLVKSLLNVSRLELGTFLVDPREVSVKETVNSILKEVEQRYKDKEQEIVVDVEDFKFYSDPQLLRMIFQNLLTNAIKYTRDKGRIEIYAHKEGDKIKIHVADNGLGIPKKQQGQIFSKLFRADNVKLKEIEGNGLGLYIIKSIVDHSGGKIWFESQEKKGTTFSIEYPASGMNKKAGEKSLN